MQLEQKIELIRSNETGFPRSLDDLKEEPVKAIYFYGDLSLAQKTENLISIVGARNASVYGKFCTRSIVKSLAQTEAIIVSGLARGIDSEAHLAALDYDLPTIAVLGSGIGTALKHGGYVLNKILNKKNFLLISEYPCDFHATRWSFPQRNRIISALAKRTVISEATTLSGSLITASYSLILGRDIYAVPGELNKENYRGNSELLAAGEAQPIFDFERWAEELEIPLKPVSEPIMAEKSSKEKILELLEAEQLSFDELSIKTKINNKELNIELSILEAKGFVKRTKFQKFSGTDLCKL